ncbi:non-ribosomal peptide synthetase [Nocardia seriolae]|uniref:non-ribosomal peptide synthetase n=1 Tax=Nocardia seriolae TaxID=37332 RepID=UPI0009F828CF|nr:non-ribosomal peptide synthetase [Nocardia seriolae]PSK29820.1 non-ribosomal peptide synthetase [Nocardia seriolae]QOW31464.1 non-ribosomal peptide synthetase [Nocardia seriolae]QUN19078.1 non-ribosomal peptide synthetase [Nocardia seriolae]WNJ58498.1 non-ribosomal peptide synthetase [Nocardia seriolae]
MANDAETLLARRKELLRRRIAESGVAAAAAPSSTAPRAKAGERHPLSDGQRRMWFLQARDPRDTTLNICVAYRLRSVDPRLGELDGERLHRAVRTVAGRHDILRTTYGLGDDGEPFQIARTDLAPGWETHDLSELPEASRARRLEVLARREFGRPFDLSSQSPLRLSLVRLARGEFALILVAHHICWDDDSWAVFFAEVNAAYRDAELAPLAGQFVDVEVLGADAVTDADLDFWREALRPLPEALELPGKTGDSGSRQAERRTLALSAELMHRVDAFARERSATPFMVLLAAYEAVVHRYTAAADFLVSVPVTVRRNAIAESLLGYFGNTLLLRATLSPRDSFAARTDAVRDTCLAAFAHQGVGIDRVVREANPERLGGKDGLDQLVRLGFSVRKSATGFALDGVEATLLDLGSTVAQLPLSLAVVLEPAGAYLEAEYQLDELDGTLVDQLLGHYAQLLGAALDEPDRRIADLDILGADAARILELSHGALVATPAITMVDLFQDRVAAAPEAMAVVAPDTGVELTYADLNRRANRMAHWLIGQGLGTEDLVGLRLSNSVEFVVGMLAVLKSGAAYLPIDPAYPDDRIDYLIEDARPRLVLGRVELDAAETSAVCLPEHDPSDTDRRRALRPGNLAYVIYTSGSTGKPKGVPVPHGAIAEHLDGFVAEWGMTAEDRLLQSSSVSFDASLLDIFVTFTAGARLVIPKPDAFRDIPYVAEIITRCGVTVLHMVPSMLSTFLLLPEVSQWRALRHVPVGGEALPGEVADKFAGIFDAELRNHYGPTEAVVCATHQDVVGPQGTRIVPIGTPNRNVFVYLLDEALQLVPTGVVGEIYLGGEQLARGYLNRAGLSAERFVADPFGGRSGVPGGRLYRTGDLARRDADGEIEFVGRADEQVKVRGFRIELGEIEAVLGGHPSVGHCVVIATEDPAVGAMLAAYVVPAPGATVDPEQLRAHAAATLPEYMVPAAVAVIDEIPLTVHGKLDKRALPAPTRRAAARNYREPATDTEIRLAALFGQLFGRDGAGADDSFFELGGHSLLATRLIVLIRKEFGVELDVRAPFDTPTVAGLAALIETAPAAEIRSETPGLAKRERPERVPLSFSQLAMWFQRKLEGPSPVGNIPFAMRVDGPLDITALAAALGDVVARHEALRTVFPEDGGVPYQSVLPAGPIDVLVTVLDDPDRLPAELAEAAAYNFAVESELLVRPKVFVLDQHSHAISLLVHHMVADHWSFRTILADLATAYRSRIDSGRPPRWEPLALDYADFALWQRELVADDQDRIDYWRDTLTGLPDEITPAHDHPRPAVLGKNGSMSAFTVPAALRRRLKSLAESAGASEFMLYQAAVVTLLHKLGAGVDIPLGTPVAGRSYPVAADLVGLLANMVVLRNDLSGDPTLRTILDRSRTTALAAYANQDVPLERVVEAVNPPRSRSRNPLFQAMMHFREEDWSATGAGLGEAELSVLPIEFDISLLDLSINFFSAPDGGFDASVIVNTDLYDPTTGTLLAHRMLTVLTAFAESPDLALSDLDVMPADERESLRRWDTGASDVLGVPAVLDRARTVPADRFAIHCGSESLTYGQLFTHLAGAAAVAPSTEQANVAGLAATVNELLSDVVTATAIADLHANEGGPGSEPGGVRLVAALWGSTEATVELLSALAAGATAVVADEEQRQDPTALVDLITRHRPTRVAADPGTLARFVHTGVSMLPSVRHWEVLGTDWPAALPDLLPALSSGSTATYAYLVPGFPGVVAHGPLTGAATAVPAPGARVLVLDDNQRPVPPGVVGTVHVGQICTATSAAATSAAAQVEVARSVPGDVSAPDRVVDPFRPGETLWRTGDRARWTVRGELEFAIERERPAARPATTASAAEFTGAACDRDTEPRLRAILAELLELEVDEVSGEDNFFALGGDSVISIQWSVRANQIGLPMSPQMVFECMTITELAEAVDTAVASGVTAADVAAAAGVSASEMTAAFGSRVPEAPVRAEVAEPEVVPADTHSHAPMSVSGLNQDALAALGAAWKGAL